MEVAKNGRKQTDFFSFQCNRKLPVSKTFFLPIFLIFLNIDYQLIYKYIKDFKRTINERIRNPELRNYIDD